MSFPPRPNEIADGIPLFNSPKLLTIIVPKRNGGLMKPHLLIKDCDSLNHVIPISKKAAAWLIAAGAGYSVE